MLQSTHIHIIQSDVELLLHRISLLHSICKQWVSTQYLICDCLLPINIKVLPLDVQLSIQQYYSLIQKLCTLLSSKNNDATTTAATTSSTSSTLQSLVTQYNIQSILSESYPIVLYHISETQCIRTFAA